MTYLYRCYGDDGRLLYVGITDVDVEHRIRQHEARGAEWIDRLAKVDREWHPDRKNALAAEAEAIKFEWPLHNIAGSISTHVVTKTKRLGWEQRTKRIRRAFYPDPMETLDAISAELAADDEKRAQFFEHLHQFLGDGG